MIAIRLTADTVNNQDVAPFILIASAVAGPGYLPPPLLFHRRYYSFRLESELPLEFLEGAAPNVFIPIALHKP